MFTELIERLRRHEDLTVEQASAAMAAIMRGEAAPAQIAGLLIGLAMKGERPSELVGLATTMREHAVPLPGARGPGVRHLRNGRRPLGQLQHLDRVRAGRGRVRRARGQARQPIGVEPVRQRRRARRPSAFNVQMSPATAGRCLDEAGIAFLFAPTFHPAMRHAAQARRDPRRAHRLQPARPAHQSGAAGPADRRRAAARADRAAGANAAGAGRRARLGRSRRRRPRRAVDDRPYQGVRSAGPAPSTPSTSTRPTTVCPKRRRRADRRRLGRPTPRIVGGCWRASRARRETSCC